MGAIAEPKIISRKTAMMLSLASAALCGLSGWSFHQAINDDVVPAETTAYLMHKAESFDAEPLTIRPQDRLPKSLLFLLSTAISGGVSMLVWPKRIDEKVFTPAKVERLQETGLLPYSPTEARSAFVEFFTGLVADYPYLSKMMGSNLIIVNGPSGAKKSRTACCFALMQWIHPDIKRTPYVLDAKCDINNDEGTWQGIPKDHIIKPSQFDAFWKRIQKEKHWVIIIDEIDEWKNAGYGDVLSQIVRVSNTQPRKQKSSVIICAHGDVSPNGMVELTKDNLGLTDADKGKINPVRKAANILTLGSYEDDYGQLRPTFQGTWKPGMCEDSQTRKITIPKSLDPSTFERYVMPFLEAAREVVTVSPVVMELENKLTEPDEQQTLIDKLNAAYQSDTPTGHEELAPDLSVLDDVAIAFLQWHWSRYGDEYEWCPRREVLRGFTHQGRRPSSEQLDNLFQALETANVIVQRIGDRSKRLYRVEISQEQI